MEHLFCVATSVRETTQEHQLLTSWRKKLEEGGVSIKPPKMGLHMTLIPPFWHTKEAAELLGWGFDLWNSSIVGTNGTHHSRGSKFDFFLSKEEDALVVRLQVDPLIEQAVERGRAKIPKMARWKFPPENYEFNPHITIGVGKEIHLRSREILRTEEFGAASWLNVTFGPPKVLMKNESDGRWIPVL